MFLYSAFTENSPEMREWCIKNGIMSFLNNKALNDQGKYIKVFGTGLRVYSCSDIAKDVNEINCTGNPNLFQAVTAMRDDSDYMQWFVSKNWRDGKDNPLPDKWVLCTCNTLAEFGKMNNSPNSYSENGFGWRKATLSELQQHFQLTPADEEIKNTEAEIHLNVKCDCPYCEEYIDLYSDLSGKCIDIFEYAERKWPVEVTCPECHRSFEITLNN